MSAIADAEKKHENIYNKSLRLRNKIKNLEDQYRRYRAKENTDLAEVIQLLIDDYRGVLTRLGRKHRPSGRRLGLPWSPAVGGTEGS